MMTSGIYLITNNINGHMYVGGSVDIKRRFSEHKISKFKKTQRIDRAINKYGADNFTYQIITELPADWKIIGKHEKYWIKFYNTFKDKKHYNLTPGGEGVQLFGEDNSFYGKHHSDETKQYLSDIKTGVPNPHTAEQNKKIGDALRGKTQENSNGFRHDLPTHEDIYNEWKTGMTQKQLAEKYNCGERTISRRIQRYKKEIGIYD